MRRGDLGTPVRQAPVAGPSYSPGHATNDHIDIFWRRRSSGSETSADPSSPRRDDGSDERQVGCQCGI